MRVDDNVALLSLSEDLSQGHRRQGADIEEVLVDPSRALGGQLIGVSNKDEARLGRRGLKQGIKQ